MSWAAAFDAQRETLERGPQAAAPATFGEIVAGNWDAAGLRELTGAGQPWAQAEGDLQRGLEAAAGKGVADLAQAQGVRLEALGWGGSTAEARAGELNRLALGLTPEAQEKLKPLLDVAGRARQIRADRERKAADVSARTYGFADNALAFAVGMGRSMVEPVNIASMAVGNPFAGSVLRMLGREAGLGMAVQAIQEPIIAAERYQLGAEVSFGESLGNIAMAGLGNAVGAGMLRAGAWALRGFRRASEALPAGEHADPVAGAREDRAADLDAAARFAEREELLGAMAPDPSPAGRAVHAEAIEISLTALEEGRAGLFSRIEAETDAALRRIDPELYARIDAIDARRAGLRAELERVTGEAGPGGRQALEPRIAALDAELEGITGKRRSSPRAERLRQEIAGLREAQGSLAAEAAAQARDTEVALRLGLSDLEMERARLGPEVNAARVAADAAGDGPELQALRAELEQLDALIAARLEAPSAEAGDAVKAAVSRVEAKAAAIPGATSALPAPADGMIRLWHGGIDQTADGTPRWFSSDRRYAEGYSSDGTVGYVDLPIDHPLLEHYNVDQYQNLRTGFTASLELPGDIADRRISVRPAQVEKQPSPAAATSAPAARSPAFPAEGKAEIARRRARLADVERALAGGDLDLVLAGETVSARQLLDDIQADATAAKALKDCLGGAA